MPRPDAELLRIRWRNRPVSLPPCAMIAFGTAATGLVTKLLSRSDEQLDYLQGVGANGMILLLGDAEALPWVDGATYLGHEPQLPSMLIPTTLEPDIPAELFERVLKTCFGAILPFAALPEKVIPFGKAKTLSRGILQRWLSANR